MSRFYMLVALMAASVVVASAPAQAHHSFAMFDRTKQVKLEGTVKEFQWTNPHSWIEIEVPIASGGSEGWLIEALSPNVLGRHGWNRAILKPSDKVTVLINPLRDGNKGGNLISVTLPDGRVLGGGAE